PADALPISPALQEGILRRVLGVVAVSEQKEQRADEFVPELVERAHEYRIGWQRSIAARDRIGRPARAEFTHGSTLTTDAPRLPIAAHAKNVPIPSAHAKAAHTTRLATAFAAAERRPMVARGGGFAE